MDFYQVSKKNVELTFISYFMYYVYNLQSFYPQQTLPNLCQTRRESEKSGETSKRIGKRRSVPWNVLSNLTLELLPLTLSLEKKSRTLEGWDTFCDRTCLTLPFISLWWNERCCYSWSLWRGQWSFEFFTPNSLVQVYFTQSFDNEEKHAGKGKIGKIFVSKRAFSRKRNYPQSNEMGFGYQNDPASLDRAA